MLNMNYFKNIETLEDLKKQYKTLALKNHLDRGGNVEMMKLINAEYDSLFAKIKDTHKNKDGEVYTRENTETAAEFKDIIDKLIKMEGLEIEIIGCFIWVSGDTKPHKDSLKAMGFRWRSKKKMWYKSPEGYKRYGKKEYSIDEIRGMYGTSGKFAGKSDERNQLEARA